MYTRGRIYSPSLLEVLILYIKMLGISNKVGAFYIFNYLFIGASFLATDRIYDFERYSIISSI